MGVYNTRAHLSEVAGVQQVLHPLGRLLALGQAQLDLQHAMREAGHLRPRKRQTWVAVPSACMHQCSAYNT